MWRRTVDTARALGLSRAELRRIAPQAAWRRALCPPPNARPGSPGSMRSGRTAEGRRGMTPPTAAERRALRIDRPPRCRCSPACPPCNLAGARRRGAPARAAGAHPGAWLRRALRRGIRVCTAGTVVRFRRARRRRAQGDRAGAYPQLLGCGEFFGASRHESGCETASACALIALDAGVLRAVAERSLVLTRRMLQAVAARLCEVEFDVAGPPCQPHQRAAHPRLSGRARRRQPGARRRDHGGAGLDQEGARRAHRHHPEAFSRSLRELPTRASSWSTSA